MLTIFNKKIIAVTMLTSCIFAASANASSTDIARLEQMLDARNQAQLVLQNSVSQLSQDVAELRGLLEKNQHRISQIEKRQRDIYLKLETVAEKAKEDTKINKQIAPIEVLNKPKVTYSGSLTENATYDAAVNLILKEKQYDQAIVALNDFITNYPQSNYLPNANYWLGQLYYGVKRDTKLAKKHFTNVVNSASSPKKPDATLKLGMIAKWENNPSKAKEYFDLVINNYPHTKAAKQAQELLK